jgi:hypothetical protein
MIDYGILSSSVSFYNKKGFTRIESPWTVSDAASAITRPEGLEPYKLEHNGKCLVASGEQSFLYLMIKGFLPEGRYQTITPCFRDESFDTMHTKYFMKNELIITYDVNVTRIDELANLALEFYRRYLPGSRIVPMSSYDPGGYSMDIMYNEYELGSYGMREHKNLSWIYGTGVAEPRLSTVMEMMMNGLPPKADT